MMRTLDEIKREIERVQTAINKTSSPKLINDYKKYLKKLRRDLKNGNYLE